MVVSPAASLTAPRNDIELCDYPAALVACEHTRAHVHSVRGRRGQTLESCSISGLVIV